MAQKPHASSVNKRKWKPKTYSTEDSDQVDLLCSPPRGSARETNGRQTHEVLERSQRKGRSEVFKEMIAQMKMRLDY